MKELRGVRDGLAKPEVQPILFGAICSVLWHVGSFDFCATCWWEISIVCLLCMRDLPPLILAPVYWIKKQEWKQTRALLA
jgi:hypothetical protein